MSENELILSTEKTFENIKHIDENGVEFWYARELITTLGYKAWRYFEAVIEKAMLACENSEMTVLEHFVVDNKTIKMPKGASKNIRDYKLTRYACYLIAQNASPRLKAVALAQTYFAVKTRQQELTEEQYKQLTEDERRMYNRKLVTDRNKYLFDTAKSSISIMPLSPMLTPESTVKPRTHGSASTIIRIIFITAIFFLDSFVVSSQKDIMFSNTAITVESAANSINTKKSVPTILPPGIILNILERVVKRKLAPTSDTSAVTPPL